LRLAGEGYPGARIAEVAALGLVGRLDEAGQKLDVALAAVIERWVGDESPTRDRAFAWFSQQFPVLDSGFKKRLAEGLEAARQMQTDRV
jgi:hypothetical protein